MSDTEAVQRFVRRLTLRHPLSAEDQAAFLALPFVQKTLQPAAYIVREGEVPTQCCLLLSGFAYRHKVTGGGERQILSVHMPGEFLDLQNSMLAMADHNVQALTRADIATVPIVALQNLARERTALGMAMWIDTLIDGSIFREWMVNIGQRSSLGRIAHLLCEFALRLEAAGLAHDHHYQLPMTQEQIADCTGLTAVHVNRVLKELGRQHLIERDKRAVSILDWDGLSHLGDFSARYLHLGNGGPTRLARRA